MKLSILLFFLLPTLSLAQVPMGDANCDGEVNVGDAVKVIDYVFLGGDAPCDMYLPQINFANSDDTVALPVGNFWFDSANSWQNMNLYFDSPTHGILHVEFTCDGTYGGPGGYFSLDTLGIHQAQPLTMCHVNGNSTVYLSHDIEVDPGPVCVFLDYMRVDEGPVTFWNRRLSALFIPSVPERK